MELVGIICVDMLSLVIAIVVVMFATIAEEWFPYDCNDC